MSAERQALQAKGFYPPPVPPVVSFVGTVAIVEPPTVTTPAEEIETPVADAAICCASETAVPNDKVALVLTGVPLATAPVVCKFKEHGSIVTVFPTANGLGATKSDVVIVKMQEPKLMVPLAFLPPEAMATVGAAPVPANATVVAAVVPIAGTAGKVNVLFKTAVTIACAVATAAGVAPLIVAVALAVTTCTGGAELPPQAAIPATSVKLNAHMAGAFAIVLESFIFGSLG